MAYILNLLKKDQSVQTIYFNEKNANGAYDALLNEDYEVLDGFIDNLPYGSHKKYLQGRSCLGPSWNSKLQNSNCLNLLNTSKQIDNYPLQIIPEINTFIRELKFKNVLISDPVTILNSSDNFEDYNSYFVDFLHPSYAKMDTIDSIIESLLQFHGYDANNHPSLEDDLEDEEPSVSNKRRKAHCSAK